MICPTTHGPGRRRPGPSRARPSGVRRDGYRFLSRVRTAAAVSGRQPSGRAGARRRSWAVASRWAGPAGAGASADRQRPGGVGAVFVCRRLHGRYRADRVRRRPYRLAVAAIALGAGACTGNAEEGGSPLCRRPSLSPRLPAKRRLNPRRPTPARPSQALPPPPTVIAVCLEDYAIAPTEVTAAAGQVTFQIENYDAVLHDVTLIATRVPVDELPTAGFSVDESNVAITTLAQTPELGAREPVALNVSLQPGRRYVTVCTVTTTTSATRWWQLWASADAGAGSSSHPWRRSRDAADVAVGPVPEGPAVRGAGWRPLRAV